jgi:xanthine/CO dehydrogenase XdhC/CoxF family maturation factor
MTHAELTALLAAAQHARTLRPAVPLALAVLVGVDGSSYRQPGALLLCDADAHVLAGAISGGCLEQDVAERAVDVCASGQAVLQAYDLREDLETIWGFGSGCEGVAHVLITPLTSLAALAAAVRGAAERTAGTLWVGLAAPHRGALEFIPDAVTSAVSTTTAPRDGWFGARLLPPVHCLIVGATRGAEAMARIAHTVGWRVTVVDHREAVLAALALPAASRSLAGAADAGAADAGAADAGAAEQSVADTALDQPMVTRAEVSPEQAAAWLHAQRAHVDARTVVALCTHRFEHDLAWLHAALATDAPYVGVLGSRQRAARLLEALGDTSAAHRARLFAPIGLDVGGDSPNEIALAAVAEMQAVLHGRQGGSLRTRTEPLHTRTPTPHVESTPVAATCRVS